MSEIILFSDTYKPINSRPLAIYRLANHLRQHGYIVQTVWAWCHVTDSEFVSLVTRLVDKNTKVIGISATLMFNSDIKENRAFGLPTDQVKERLSLLKKLAPNAKIVVGGASVTFNSTTYLNQFTDVDYYALAHQGEEVFLNIVKHIHDPAHKIVTQTITKPYYVSDQVYSYNTFNQSTNIYDSSDMVQYGESLPLEIARGCIFKCSFCAYELTGKKPRDYTKTFDILRNELITNYNEYGTQYYSLIDDLVNDSTEKVEMILRLADSLPFQIRFDGFLRMDMLRAYPHTAKQLKDAGLLGAFFGLETINDKSGKSVGKGLGKARTSETIAFLNEVWDGEIISNAGFIAGLPYWNSESKYELLEWLQLPEQQKFFKLIKVGPLWISKNLHSEIGKNPEKFGYTIFENSALGDFSQISYDWKTDDYSFKQAMDDANFVVNQFYSKFKYKTKYSTFSTPYVFSLCENKDDVMKLYCHDQSDIFSTDEEWKSYVEARAQQHKQAYLTSLMSKKS